MSVCTHVYVHVYATSIGGKILLTGGATGGGLCEKPGAAHARYSLLQPDTMDPLQDVGESVSQAGGTSGKTYLRKGRGGVKTKKDSENQQMEHQGERRRQRRCPRCQSKNDLAVCEETTG